MKKVFVALIALVAIAVAMPPPALASVATNVDYMVALPEVAPQFVAGQHQIAAITVADVLVADSFQFAIQTRDKIADNRHPALVSSEVLITDSWAKRNGQANSSQATVQTVIRV